MAETVFKRLSRYHQDSGILSTSSACPHREQRSGGSQGLTGPNPAFASAGHEKEA